MPRSQRFRYQSVADFIQQLVCAGTLMPGDRVPSLRAIARTQRTSLTTAMQAYRLLEDRGVLEARPQSGFYVARDAAPTLAPPAKSTPPRRARQVTVPDVVEQLLEVGSDPRYAPLGCAIPSPELLGAGRLDRYLARAAREKGAQYNTYSTPQGDLRLRQEIARRALQWGQALSAEAIAITCGCTEALALALRTLARRGDTVVIESPTYFGLLQVVASLGLKVIELPTDANTGIDIDALRTVLERHEVAACLLSSSFNNPLGATTPIERKRQILDVLADHRVPLVEDDIYGDIHFGNERPVPFIALDSDADVIYCSSFSKTIAPGYRVGWVASSRHMREILRHKFATTLCGPTLTQAAIADFLATGGYDNHLRRVRRTFSENIYRTLRVVGEAFPSETRATTPEGGFVIWLELPGGVNTSTLFTQALGDGICFAPGCVFSTTDRFTHCLRLSCGHTWNGALERALRRLGQLVHQALRRH